ARLAPARELPVGAVVAALGHGLMQQIWGAEVPLLELALHALELALGACELRGEAFAACDESGQVLATRFRLTDCPCLRIALGAQPVDLHRPGLTLLLQCPERAYIEHKAASREVARHGVRIGAQQLRIDHRA